MIDKPSIFLCLPQPAGGAPRWDGPRGVCVWVAQPMKSQHIDADMTRSHPPRALPEPNAELRSSSASGDSERVRRFVYTF